MIFSPLQRANLEISIRTKKKFTENYAGILWGKGPGDREQVVKSNLHEIIMTRALIRLKAFWLKAISVLGKVSVFSFVMLGEMSIRERELLLEGSLSAQREAEVVAELGEQMRRHHANVQAETDEKRREQERRKMACDQDEKVSVRALLEGIKGEKQ